jgi:hypothetical protein
MSHAAERENAANASFIIEVLMNFQLVFFQKI